MQPASAGWTCQASRDRFWPPQNLVYYCEIQTRFWGTRDLDVRSLRAAEGAGLNIQNSTHGITICEHEYLTRLHVFYTYFLVLSCNKIITKRDSRCSILRETFATLATLAEEMHPTRVTSARSTTRRSGQRLYAMPKQLSTRLDTLKLGSTTRPILTTQFSSETLLGSSGSLLVPRL